MKVLLSATAALLVAVALPASAAQVQVGFDLPTYTFTDLDPNDGIAAGWTLSDLPDAGRSYSRYSEVKEGGSIDDSGPCPRNGACFSTLTSGPAYSRVDFIGIDDEYLLAPNTRMTATFQVLADAVARPGEIVNVSVDLTLTALETADRLSHRSIALDGTDSFSGSITLTLTNDTNRPMAALWYGALSYLADGTGAAPPPPVPEPQTWALMALGLAGVVGFSRGQQRRRQAACPDPVAGG